MPVKYPLTNPVRPGDLGYEAAVNPPPDGKPAPTPSEGKLPPIAEPSEERLRTELIDPLGDPDVDISDASPADEGEPSGEAE